MLRMEISPAHCSSAHAYCWLLLRLSGIKIVAYMYLKKKKKNPGRGEGCLCSILTAEAPPASWPALSEDDAKLNYSRSKR